MHGANLKDLFVGTATLYLAVTILYLRFESIVAVRVAGILL